MAKPAVELCIFIVNPLNNFNYILELFPIELILMYGNLLYNMNVNLLCLISCLSLSYLPMCSVEYMHIYPSKCC